MINEPYERSCEVFRIVREAISMCADDIILSFLESIGITSGIEETDTLFFFKVSGSNEKIEKAIEDKIVPENIEITYSIPDNNYNLEFQA